MNRNGSFTDASMQDVAIAVLDTNVFLDWLVFDDPRVAPLVAACTAGAVRCIGCLPMRDELARMLASARLARWSPDAQAALRAHDARVERVGVAPTQRRLICTDADDQVFLDLALERSAQWLITHDRALLRLARRARALGVDILTPADWARQAEKKAAVAAV